MRLTSATRLSPVIVGLLLAHAGSASAAVVTLGDQDFADGETPFGGSAGFNARSVGEPAPFNEFRGTDIFEDNNFSGTWTFTYPLQPVFAPTITFGLYDHDSMAAGNQVALFTLDGIDLTGLANAALESRGGGQAVANVYTIALPLNTYAALADGSATFVLNLQPPGLNGELANSASNAAGIDFAALSVPEPGCLGAIAVIGLLAARRVRHEPRHRAG